MKNIPHPVIIKWRKKQHYSHNISSWKIAYADFATAMMAFFLVMWLVGATTPQQREQIAEYFRMPLKEAINHNRKLNISNFQTPTNLDSSNVNSIDLLQHQLKYQKDIRRLYDTSMRLESMLHNDPRLRELQSNIRIMFMHEGLHIEIIDSNKRPMFATGGTEIAPHMRNILHIIAPVLNDLPNHINLVGHTDNQPYLKGDRGYSNWELSADRANASRRELVEGGLRSDKIMRVIGMANTMPLPKGSGDNAAQRRISIIILTLEQEEAIRQKNNEDYIKIINSNKDAVAQLQYLTNSFLNKEHAILKSSIPTDLNSATPSYIDGALNIKKEGDR